MTSPWLRSWVSFCDLMGTTLLHLPSCFPLVVIQMSVMMPCKASPKLWRLLGGQTRAKPVKLPAGSFSWKSYRQATKAVLAGLANSLRNCLPGSWNLSKCIPPNLLSPASLGCDRVAMVEMEEMMFQDCGKKNLFFNYDFRSFKGTPQFYLDESFHRLIFSADEGTEASLISGKNMGCTGFLFSFIREISCFLCGRRI